MRDMKLTKTTALGISLEATHMYVRKRRLDPGLRAKSELLRRRRSKVLILERPVLEAPQSRRSRIV